MIFTPFSKDRLVCIAGLSVFGILYLIFYPSIYSFRDEASYLSMAYLLRSGRFFIDGSGIPFQSWIDSGGHRVFDYPVGMPLFLLPFIFFGWQASFIASLSAHILGSVYFGKLLKVFGVQQSAWTLLYLFHPAFIFYSRTIMSDVPAAAFFLAGVYYYFKNHSLNWKTGLFFGFSFLLRPSGAVYFLPFAVAGVWRGFKTDKKCLVNCFLVFSSVAALAGIAQYLFYGSPFLTPYSSKFSPFQEFSLRYMPDHLRYYFLSLMLTYPLMLLVPFTAKDTRRPEMLGSVFLGVLFFSSYTFRDDFYTNFQTMILGNRFLFPAISLFLLMYAEGLNRFVEGRGFVFQRTATALLCIFLFCSAIFIHQKHQSALEEPLRMKDAIYKATPEGSAIIYDITAAKLMHAAWGDRRFIDSRDTGMNPSDFLKGADFKRGVFGVKLGGEPGKFGASWVVPEEEDGIRQLYKIKLIAKQDRLEIYQFYDPKH